MDKSELKPCPFCGGEGKICGSFGSSKTYIFCDFCEAKTGYGYEQHVISAWNRRGDGWISAAERLPAQANVLVWIPNVGCRIGYYNSKEEYKCWMEGAGVKLPTVTHWLPLPKVRETRPKR